MLIESNNLIVRHPAVNKVVLGLVFTDFNCAHVCTCTHVCANVVWCVNVNTRCMSTYKPLSNKQFRVYKIIS